MSADTVRSEVLPVLLFLFVMLAALGIARCADRVDRLLSLGCFGGTVVGSIMFAYGDGTAAYMTALAALALMLGCSAAMNVRRATKRRASP